jgi:hypothetical protein
MQHGGTPLNKTYTPVDIVRSIAQHQCRRGADPEHMRELLQILKGIPDLAFEFGIFFARHALLRLTPFPAN